MKRTTQWHRIVAGLTLVSLLSASLPQAPVAADGPGMGPGSNATFRPPEVVDAPGNLTSDPQARRTLAEADNEGQEGQLRQMWVEGAEPTLARAIDPNPSTIAPIPSDYAPGQVIVQLKS